MTSDNNLLETQAFCPPAAAWSAFRSGQVAAVTLQGLAEHLETCPDCAAVLDSVPEAADPLLQDLREPPIECLPLEELHRITALVERLAPRVTETYHPGGAEAAAVKEGGRLGPYELQTLVGAGGMGRVYKAHDAYLDRTVAIKLIAGRHLTNPAAVARFRREMQALARLDHPHIVRAYHADRAGDAFYLVMEYVEGQTLAEVVRRRGQLSWAQACVCVDQVADALQEAHQLGLSHRDITPNNILLLDAATEQPQVKVLDFGLAQLQEANADVAGLTQEGQAIGTPEFMAPEQWDNAHTADIRADLYGLGCTLFYVLTGRPPFPREDYPDRMHLWQAHATAPAPSVRQFRPEVPAALDAVLARLLAKRPEERFATPAQLRAALQPLLEQAGTPAKTKTFAESKARVWHMLQAHTRWLIAMACALAVAMLVWLSWPRRSSTPDSASQQMALPKRPADERPMAVSGPVIPLRIDSFRLLHYRGDKQPRALGELGLGAPFTLADDDVRVRVRLSRSAYCYLLAFRPDGTEDLCFPSDRNTASRPIADLDYPSAPDGYYGLTDGIGLEAFVLLASEQPLPSYAVWEKKHGAPPWRAVALTEGIWQGDGQTLWLAGRQVRGERRKGTVPLSLVGLQRYFRRADSTLAVQMIGFPVRKTKETP